MALIMAMGAVATELIFAGRHRVNAGFLHCSIRPGCPADFSRESGPGFRFVSLLLFYETPFHHIHEFGEHFPAGVQPRHALSPLSSQVT